MWAQRFLWDQDWGSDTITMSSGPDRVVTNKEEDPEFKRRKVGFTAELEETCES